MVSSLGEGDITVNLLVQVDRLVQLLETPIFAYLRLQLLDPVHFHHLLKTLYGLLMLLPQQSTAFRILRTRLRSIPLHLPLSPQEGPEGGGVEVSEGGEEQLQQGESGAKGEKMQQFAAVQQWHRDKRKETLGRRHGGGRGGANSHVSGGEI